jgi:putative ABC transport system permease protein
MSAVRPLYEAVKSLGRRRAFAPTVVVTLALGIAPSAMIFAIMDAVYFRPLPYPAQERLVLLNISRKDAPNFAAIDAHSFGEWRARNRSFTGLAAYRATGFDVTVGARPLRLTGQRVTADFFPVLGVGPALGRVITAADCATGAPPVVVLRYQTWREEFEGRQDIVNLPVRMNGEAATIVGVMPEAFTSFMEGRSARAWAPLPHEPRTAPGGPEVNVVGRLKLESVLLQAQADVASIQATVDSMSPEVFRGRRVVARDFRSALFSGLGPGLRMLAIIVGLLLLIACANAANLLLARAEGRVREVALRSALGATRFRLALAHLGESLLLAMVAAGTGLVIAFWGVRFVWTSSAPIFVRIGVNSFAFDGRVVAFSLALTTVSVALFGLGPAIRGSRGDIAEVLKTGQPGSGSGRRAGRLARALVVCQVTLCVFTLVVATLMVRSFTHFARLSADPGFDPAGFVVATLPPPEDTGQPDARVAAVRQIEARVAAAPGVDLVAVSNRLPFLEAGASAVVTAGPEPRGSVPRIDADLRAVNPGYFAAAAMVLLKGRGIEAQDAAGSQRVAVIDERLAQSAFRTSDPVGRRLFVDGVERSVVGVVRVKAEPSPFRSPAREVYVPYTQAEAGSVTLMVRSRLSPEVVVSEVRSAVAAVDANQPVVGLEPLSQTLDSFMTPFRLILSLMTGFSAIALALAAVGLYGVLSRGVSRRTREIGVRMAMGAGRREVVALVMGEGLRSAAVGLTLGLLLGLAAARLLPSEILGVGGVAPWQYLGVMLIWLAAATVACAVPANRAAAVDPIDALRQ